MSRRTLTVIVCTLALPPLVAPAASARLRTFGANLDRPANVTYGCETAPSIDAFGNRALRPTGARTCTYLVTGALGNTTEVAATPTAGVVTRVRVKAGPVTGPTQVTVLRATRSTIAGFACCFYASESRVFTPRPNAITGVNVRLPVRSDLNPDPQVGETVDYLGLTVLAPGVPIPAQDLGVPGNLNLPGALGFFPHVKRGDTRVDGGGFGAFVPLLNADLLPLCRGGVSSAARPKACAPVVGVARSRARVRGPRVVLPLECNIGLTCLGVLKLQPRRTRGAIRVRSAANPTYARVRIRIGAARTKTVRARLSRAGRRLLRRRKRVRVWSNTRFGSGSSAVTLSERVTLRR